MKPSNSDLDSLFQGISYRHECGELPAWAWRYASKLYQAVQRIFALIATGDYR